MAEKSNLNYLAVPPLGKGPGILVLHAWWGLNAFCQDFCQRLVKEGFVVLAPDLYHGKTASTIDEAKKLRLKLSQQQVKTDLLAGTEQLSTLPAVTGDSLGVIGFSLGAYWGLWLALEKPELIKAVTVFYGTRSADYTPSRAAYLGHFAAEDVWTPASGVKKMKKAMDNAGRPVTFYTYPGTSHWFFEQDRQDAYNKAAAELAWERSLEFFKQQLG